MILCKDEAEVFAPVYWDDPQALGHEVGGSGVVKEVVCVYN